MGPQEGAVLQGPAVCEEVIHYDCMARRRGQSCGAGCLDPGDAGRGGEPGLSGPDTIVIGEAVRQGCLDPGDDTIVIGEAVSQGGAEARFDEAPPRSDAWLGP